MNRHWLVVAAMAAEMLAQAQECNPGSQTLTVFTDPGKTAVPNGVLARARSMAAKVLAGADVKVEWAKGRRPDPQRFYCGELLTIAFDASADSTFAPKAMAYARLNGGSATEIHIFYDRVASYPDSGRMPEFMGHIIAHEIAHILEGVARHSDEGVMKARWNDRECSELGRGPLAFAPEDLELIRAHFNTRVSR